MTIGLSTYSFFWQLSAHAATPLALPEVITETANLGVELLQICDYPAIEQFSPAQLAELRDTADRAGVQIELGTKGIQIEHLRRYLDIADALGATLLRSMVNSADHQPTFDEAVDLLQDVLPELNERGITLALETYEQIPTADLVRLVERVASPMVGICVDPANMVAALEHPRDVVESVASRVVSIHVKDFDFTRSEGWVGFSLSGAPLGTGRLDYAHLLEVTRPAARGINQIIEHWLPWQGDAIQTCRVEQEWTTRSLTYLQTHT